jgi:hypothetical protein
MSESHDQGMARMRRAYREAHDRFVKRLREAPDEAVHRVTPDGGWSAAQVGWHVAEVDSRFAGLVSGELPGAQPLPAGTIGRPWTEIAAAIPEKIIAGKSVQPPPNAQRDAVLASLGQSAEKLDAALAGLDESRATGYAIAHPVMGTVSVGQIGEWATAHVIRHNAQAKRLLGA